MLRKKGEINDVWKTMLSSCKILHQPQCSSKQNPDKEIIMESSLGGVQDAMQINAQKPGGHLSCKFHLILFWDGRRIKSWNSEDRNTHR